MRQCQSGRAPPRCFVGDLQMMGSNQPVCAPLLGAQGLACLKFLCMPRDSRNLCLVDDRWASRPLNPRPLFYARCCE